MGPPLTAASSLEERMAFHMEESKKLPVIDPKKEREKTGRRSFMSTAKAQGEEAELPSRRRRSSATIPKEEDPNTGAWSKWSCTKDMSVMAALDAAFAVAEAQLRDGEGEACVGRWRSR